jgi:molybdenum cofactor cytidylyltransferase
MIPAIVLAAGRSTRMGRAKALLPVDDRDTFLTRIVRTFLDADVEEVVVVVGHEPDAIVSAFAGCGLAARFVRNADYDRGQLSSLVAALTVIDRPGVAAALVTLVDVPLVSPATVRAVVARYRETHAPIVRPTSGDRHGHPLLIDRSLFAELRAADPESGAKPIVRAHASAAGDLPIADEGAFLDIDTAEEYARVIGGISDRSSGGADDQRPSRAGDPRR